MLGEGGGLSLVDAAHCRSIYPPPLMTEPLAPETLQVQFSVPFAYDISFTREVFALQNHVFLQAIMRQEPHRCHRLLVIVDASVARAHPHLCRDIELYVEAHSQQLQLARPPLVVEGGEACKNDPGAVERLYEAVASAHIDRQSFCVLVGGGALLDMAGYAAATAHRGVRTIRLPTTVLSQNDSGVGVKNGVNFRGLKNFAGSFAVPYAVINDAVFLETLERRDKIAGMAEAVKVSLIKDLSFFEWLELNVSSLAVFEAGAMQTMIARCAQLHVQHIAGSGDPFEQGSARPLDFGHWAAHKLESLSSHRLRHGEAVAIGIALDVRYCVQTGLISEHQGQRVWSMLTGLGFCLWAAELSKRNAEGDLCVLDGLDEFREHLGGELTVSLLRSLGQGFEVHEIVHGQMLASVKWLQQQYGSEGQP